MQHAIAELTGSFFKYAADGCSSRYVEGPRICARGFFSVAPSPGEIFTIWLSLGGPRRFCKMACLRASHPEVLTGSDSTGVF